MQYITSIYNQNEGKKWEIFKEDDRGYALKYYEYFIKSGFQFISLDRHLHKDVINYIFDIDIDNL